MKQLWKAFICRGLAVARRQTVGHVGTRPPSAVARRTVRGRAWQADDRPLFVQRGKCFKQVFGNCWCGFMKGSKNAVKFVSTLTCETIDSYCWPKCCWTYNLPPWPKTKKHIARNIDKKERNSLPIWMSRELVDSVTLCGPITKGVVVVRWQHVLIDDFLDLQQLWHDLLQGYFDNKIKEIFLCNHTSIKSKE